MAEQPQDQRPTTVLLLGPSALFWQDSPQEPALHARIAARLPEIDGAREWRCVAERAFSGPGLAPRVEQLLTRHNPDAVVLVLGSGPFEAKYVVEAIRRRWPSVYRAAQAASQLLKDAAGGGLEGAAGPRGWLFRGPRNLAALFFGMESMQPPEEAILVANEAIDVLARFESTYTLAYFVAVCWPPSHTEELRLIAKFNAEVRAHAESRRIDYRFRQEEMRAKGVEPRLGRTACTRILRCTISTRTLSPVY